MLDPNRFAPPTAEVALPEPPRVLRAEELNLANTSLKRARLGFVVFFLSLVAQIYGAKGRPEWTSLFLLLYLLSFLAAHFFLGQAARRASRSWLMYGLAPIVVPPLGGIISFGLLRHFIPEPSPDQ